MGMEEFGSREIEELSRPLSGLERLPTVYESMYITLSLVCGERETNTTIEKVIILKL